MLSMLSRAVFVVTAVSLLCCSPVEAVDVGDRVTLKARKPVGVPLHSRAEPSLFGRAPDGARADVIAVSDDGRWLHLRLNDDREGWVTLKYVAGADSGGGGGEREPVIDEPPVQPRSGGAQAVESEHCLHRCPSTTAGNDLVRRQIYILSSNPETKFADWVAYHLDASIVADVGSAARNYKADPKLDPARTLERDDYKDAFAAFEYSKGHQAPIGSFKGSGRATDTNYLSNLTPQKGDLNSGAWNRLEMRVRQLARRGNVWIVTGPVYERSMPRMPRADEPHTVPSGYFKIVMTRTSSGELELAAFFMDQETSKNARYCDHLTTVDVLEEKTGLDFFTALDDGPEAALESGENALARALGCFS